MTNLEKYNSVFIEVLEVDVDELNESFIFGEIKEWDSLGHMGLITELETTFNIMLETEEILSYGSYQNGIKILEKHGIVMSDIYGE